VLTTVIGALLPVIVTLLLGIGAAWHHDFSDKEASALNRMVMLYALPMLLFAGIVATPRSHLTADLWLGVVILIGMMAGFLVPLLIAMLACKRDLTTSALQALAIGGPSVAFVGFPVLGYLFGPSPTTIAVAISSLVFNVVQIPLTMVLLSVGAAQAGSTGQADGPRKGALDHVLSAARQPVVWAPILAFIIMLTGIHLAPQIRLSFDLLGKATGGVALFASGIVLYSRRVSFGLPVAISTVARNLVIPAAVWVLAVLLRLSPESTKMAVISLAIPTSSACVILAVQAKTAEQEIASTLFFSTILSLPTMGLFIWLMGA
jgi:malonate transporter